MHQVLEWAKSRERHLRFSCSPILTSSSLLKLHLVSLASVYLMSIIRSRILRNHFVCYLLLPLNALNSPSSLDNGSGFVSKIKRCLPITEVVLRVRPPLQSFASRRTRVLEFQTDAEIYACFPSKVPLKPSYVPKRFEFTTWSTLRTATVK